MSKGKVTAEQLNASAWAAALASPLVPDKVPPGWLTAVELADLLGKNRDSISRSISVGVRAGRIEMKKFRVVNGQRGLYPTPHYRLLK
jgi:hypothetical protein